VRTATSGFAGWAVTPSGRASARQGQDATGRRVKMRGRQQVMANVVSESPYYLRGRVDPTLAGTWSVHQDGKGKDSRVNTICTHRLMNSPNST